MASVYRRGFWTTTRGKKVRRKCRAFTVQWTDQNGLHTVRGFDVPEGDDIRAAELASIELGRNAELLTAGRARQEQPDAKLTAWLASLPERIRADLAAEGVIDQRPELRRRPLADHIADYKADLEATGRDEEYTYIVEKRLEKLQAATGWKTLADITSDSFTTWRTKRKGTAAPRTLNQYQQTLAAFLQWCRKHGRLDSDPIAGVTTVDERGKQRRKRRAFTLHELELLIEHAGDRALCYKTVIYCQLRREDARALRWGDVHEDSLPPYLLTRAETSKGKRETRHPLRGDLAAELAKARPANARPTDRVFRVPCIKYFRKHLTAAGIDYTDEFGRVADFHSLGRQTPNTMMANAGVAPRTAQELMRHTDIKLTMGPYIDPGMLNKAAAVETLPELGTGKHTEAPQILKMTGTGDTGKTEYEPKIGKNPLKRNLKCAGGETGFPAIKSKTATGGTGGETCREIDETPASRKVHKCSKNQGLVSHPGGGMVSPGGDNSYRGGRCLETGPLGLEPRTS